MDFDLTANRFFTFISLTRYRVSMLHYEHYELSSSLRPWEGIMKDALMLFEWDWEWAMACI